MEYTVYVGTNSVRDSRGIYVLRLDDAGRGGVIGSVPAYNSGYLALNGSGTRLYAVSEGMSFMGRASGGVLAYDISGGLPREMNRRLSGGQRPCCVCLSGDGSELFAANFFGGSVAAFPIEPDGSLGEMRALKKEKPLPGRLDGMHCVEALPGGEAGCVYLGTGSVIIYNAADFSEKQRFSLEGGAFPRHFAASRDGKTLYLLLQTPAELHTAVRDENGLFRVKSVLSALPEDFSGHAEAAAVRVTPDGRLLLASVRIADTVAVFRLDGDTGLPQKPNIVKLPVKTPRDICLTPDGRLLLITGQASDNICVCAVDGESASLRVLSVIEGVVSPCALAVREG